jgi:Family of unknown function (DUF6353)
MNSNWAKVIARFTKENAPTILTGLACAGVVGTVVLAVRATPDAMTSRAGVQEDADAENRDLSIQETVKATWKHYIPAAIAGTATIGCIIGANRIGVKRYAALAGAYGLLEKGFREYRDKVLTEVGEKKEQAIRDKIAQDRVGADPVRSSVVIIGNGEVMCYDMEIGRYFKSSHEDIRRAENDFNREVLHDLYCDLNKFYELLGLPPVDVGDRVGWNVDHPMELTFTSVLNDDAQPCLAVSFKNPPRADFGKIY